MISNAQGYLADRSEMVTYLVVLVFLILMTALVAGVDYVTASVFVDFISLAESAKRSGIRALTWSFSCRPFPPPTRSWQEKPAC